jgi:hypothetical protein
MKEMQTHLEKLRVQILECELEIRRPEAPRSIADFELTEAPRNSPHGRTPELALGWDWTPPSPVNAGPGEVQTHFM